MQMQMGCKYGMQYNRYHPRDMGWGCVGLKLLGKARRLVVLWVVRVGKCVGG